MRKIARSAAALARNEEGTSVIEFGLFAPILALMVMGISDTAMGYSYKLTLEQGANRTLEKVATGMVTDFSTLEAEAATAAGVGLDEVQMNQWLECDGPPKLAFDAACTTGQEIARYIEIDIDSVYTPIFSAGPFAHALGGENGQVPVTATVALRIQ